MGSSTFMELVVARFLCLTWIEGMDIPRAETQFLIYIWDEAVALL